MDEESGGLDAALLYREGFEGTGSESTASEYEPERSSSVSIEEIGELENYLNPWQLWKECPIDPWPMPTLYQRFYNFCYTLLTNSLLATAFATMISTGESDFSDLLKSNKFLEYFLGCLYLNLFLKAVTLLYTCWSLFKNTTRFKKTITLDLRRFFLILALPTLFSALLANHLYRPLNSKNGYLVGTIAGLLSVLFQSLVFFGYMDHKKRKKQFYSYAYVKEPVWNSGGYTEENKKLSRQRRINLRSPNIHDNYDRFWSLYEAWDKCRLDPFPMPEQRYFNWVYHSIVSTVLVVGISNLLYLIDQQNPFHDFVKFSYISLAINAAIRPVCGWFWEIFNGSPEDSNEKLVKNFNIRARIIIWIPAIVTALLVHAFIYPSVAQIGLSLVAAVITSSLQTLGLTSCDEAERAKQFESHRFVFGEKWSNPNSFNHSQIEARSMEVNGYIKNSLNSNVPATHFECFSM